MTSSDQVVSLSCYHDNSVPAKGHARGSKTAISRLRSHFSRLVEKFDTHFEKNIKYLNKLESMRENSDRTFAKSPILAGKVTGDEVVFRSFGTGKRTSASGRLDETSSERLWKSLDVFGNLRTSSDIIGPLRKILTLSG